MDLSRTAALRLTIFLSQDDQFRHRPLYTEIVHRAHAAGLAGATVLRGYEGFGASGRIHTTRLLSLTDDLPAVVVIIDMPERIEAFLPEVRELVTNGLITLDEVTIVAPPRSSEPASHLEIHTQ